MVKRRIYLVDMVTYHNSGNRRLQTNVVDFCVVRWSGTGLEKFLVAITNTNNGNFKRQELFDMIIFNNNALRRETNDRASIRKRRQWSVSRSWWNRLRHSPGTEWRFQCADDAGWVEAAWRRCVESADRPLAETDKNAPCALRSPPRPEIQNLDLAAGHNIIFISSMQMIYSMPIIIWCPYSECNVILIWMHCIA